MSFVPKGWSVKTFGEVLSLITNGMNGKQNKEGNGIPLSRIETIADQRVDLSRVGFLAEYDEGKIDKYRLEEGDILFSHINSPIHLGKTALVSADIVLYHGVNLLRLKCEKSVDPRFFNYYCKYLRALGEFSKNAQHAVNQSSINQKKLKAFELVAPSLEEQKRIADKLDSVLAKVEAAQARLDKIPAILKRFRQSVLAAATSGELTKEWRDDEPNEETAITLLAKLQDMRKDLYIDEITRGNKETKRLSAKVKNHSPVLPTSRLPNGWAWTSFMSSMLKVVDCHNKTAPYIESGIPLIRTTDIRDGVISLKGAKFISQETYEFWARRCPPEPGDIIFTREAPMGEAGVVPDDTRLCMGQRMMLLRPAPEYVLAKYVVFNTLSLDFKERMNRQAIGSGVKHLRVADVEALTFPLPPLKEQKEIVRRIEKLFEEASLVENQYNAAKARLDNLTQSILARAFKGELLTKPVESEITEIENSVEALNA